MQAMILSFLQERNINYSILLIAGNYTIPFHQYLQKKIDISILYGIFVIVTTVNFFLISVKFSSSATRIFCLKSY